MQRAEAQITVADDGRVDIRTDLGKLDPCDIPGILTGLAIHLGFESAPLLKAIRRKPAQVDPRYPALRTLIKQAHINWHKYGDTLVAEVRKLLDEGKLLPLSVETEEILRRLFAEHEVAVVLSFGGKSRQEATVKRMVDEGTIAEDYEETALVTLGYKLGRGLDALAIHHIQPDQEPSLETVIRQAGQTRLNKQDRHALDYARRRAAVYMRRPAQLPHYAIERQLTEAERWAVSREVEKAVEGRKGQAELARELEAATKDTTLINDMDRVARTELHFAHSHGAYIGLKEQAAGAGDDDPLVYKLVRPQACTHCRRIWGPNADPIRYRLSFIEAREAQGANFHKPASTWGPTIGPVHPNCTEGALLYWHPDIHDAIQEAAAEMAEWYGT
tara:strand:- start:947 stop:2110 length:1164 start_codon:yes stop_codon:yes gene_type:complete